MEALKATSGMMIACKWGNDSLSISVLISAKMLSGEETDIESLSITDVNAHGYLRQTRVSANHTYNVDKYGSIEKNSRIWCIVWRLTLAAGCSLDLQTRRELAIYVF
jgi:hypothetical protein